MKDYSLLTTLKALTISNKKEVKVLDKLYKQFIKYEQNFPPFEEEHSTLDFVLHHRKVYLIEYNYKVIGFAIVDDNLLDSNFLESLYIIKKFRNKGCGKTCIKRLLDIYNEVPFRVNCYLNNTEALMFYYKQGFLPYYIGLYKGGD